MTVNTTIAGLSENGVKDTISQYQHHHRGVENTLQNGVKI